ncbi:hypothetical protein H6P81_015811 [Aristolochia fimbriata]|uniref:Uncharacterized protein n=1 Tax=Aristolochia fimbriata TaxID=158543 RepID=A0AAV7E7U4_ARIFI|nr:hypothetical protein H6P81_015811 [Aristolochia fimbriata]
MLSSSGLEKDQFTPLFLFCVSGFSRPPSTEDFRQSPRGPLHCALPPNPQPSTTAGIGSFLKRQELISIVRCRLHL